MFEKPAPGGAGDDPRVIALQAATERITSSLTAVRGRLKDLRSRLDTKPQTEQDLAKAAAELKPLTVQAREDCDAILRAATDLKTELRTAAKGYSVTADLYRERAETIKDPSLKAVQLRMADEFDRLALDVPRRKRVAEEFIARLATMQDFLAEADRCLADTKTALAILSAGPEPVKASEEGKAFRRHLEQFLAVLEEYQSQLLPARPASSKPTGTAWDLVTSPRPDCPPPPPPSDLKLSAPGSPGVGITRPYQCPHCKEYHVGAYRVEPAPEFEGLTPYTGEAAVRPYTPPAGGK